MVSLHAERELCKQKGVAFISHCSVTFFLFFIPPPVHVFSSQIIKTSLNVFFVVVVLVGGL